MLWQSHRFQTIYIYEYIVHLIMPTPPLRLFSVLFYILQSHHRHQQQQRRGDGDVGGGGGGYNKDKQSRIEIYSWISLY